MNIDAANLFKTPCILSVLIIHTKHVTRVSFFLKQTILQMCKTSRVKAVECIVLKLVYRMFDLLYKQNYFLGAIIQIRQTLFAK